MNTRILDGSQVDEVVPRLDALLGQVLEGLQGPVVAPRVLPAAVYDSVPPEELRLWCHVRAIYGIPTTEAIAWLQRYIRGRSALEIGAAQGVFGEALGIPMTDSFVQADEAVSRDYYALFGQPTVQYAKRVEQMDALKAVKHYRPQVVFGSWVTQYGLEGQACMFGVREDQILARKHVRAYVVFGSHTVHSGKAVGAQVPKGWRFRSEVRPGFRSRSLAPATMFLWERV